MPEAHRHPRRDPWRQQFHVTAPRGLVNDPNGLIYWKGVHHVFFQWNPKGCAHENKSWGHAASADLVNWQRLPSALEPTEAYDSHGCYSGSAVVDGDDLVLVYTGNVKTAAGERRTFQCLARSQDGVRFAKLGPVISGPPAGYTAHFRDPKVWREDGAWKMVIGAQTEALAGTVLMLSSPDLATWRVDGPLLVAGRHGYMCECPDLFALDGEDALLFSEQHPRPFAANGGPAFSGNVAGVVIGRREGGAFVHGPFRRLDHGRDFYAPQTYLAADGRRLMFGWMGLPEQGWAPTVADGWLHSLTLPRELSLVGGRLRQQPARELAALRGPARFSGPLAVGGRCRLVDDAGPAYELEVELDAEAGVDLAIDLRVGNGERTTLRLDRWHGSLELSNVDAAGRVELLAACGEATVRGERLRIFVDRSSIEVFVDDGAAVFSARIYPGAGAEAIEFDAPAGAAIRSLTLWPLLAARTMQDAA